MSLFRSNIILSILFTEGEAELEGAKRRPILSKKTLLVCILVLPGIAQNTQNALSGLEEEHGYDLLFNGETLEGWHGYRMQEPPDSWEAKTEGERGARIEIVPGDKISLLSDSTYTNFDLKIDWGAELMSNSGIFTRYLEESPKENEDVTGPQAQVVGSEFEDPPNDSYLPGAVLDVIPLRPEALDWYNPDGEYNEFRIIAWETKVAHYGNGRLLLWYDTESPEWEAAYQNSKYNDSPRFGDVHAGSVFLQHHGQAASFFRNIKAKELLSDPWTELGFGEGMPEELEQQSVFNDAGQLVSPVSANKNVNNLYSDYSRAVLPLFVLEKGTWYLVKPGYNSSFRLDGRIQLKD